MVSFMYKNHWQYTAQLPLQIYFFIETDYFLMQSVLIDLENKSFFFELFDSFFIEVFYFFG